jgi:hypothetical protein
VNEFVLASRSSDEPIPSDFKQLIVLGTSGIPKREGTNRESPVPSELAHPVISAWKNGNTFFAGSAIAVPIAEPS